MLGTLCQRDQVGLIPPGERRGFYIPCAEWTDSFPSLNCGLVLFRVEHRGDNQYIGTVDALRLPQVARAMPES